MNIADPQVVCAFILKPAGITSHDVIYQLRKAFPGVKMGHGGTLDPFATGVLPVFFGTWTRLSSLFSFSDKRYKATLSLGSSTDTGDWTGQVTRKKAIPLITSLQLKMLERKAVGQLELPIPIYSALKVDGRPMHELARKGELTQSIRSRKSEIYHLSLEQSQAGEILVDVTCSHGTYIRSLGEYLAKQLQTCGHLTALERVSYGPVNKPYPFCPVELDVFKKNPEKGWITLASLEHVLPTYQLSASQYHALKIGKQRYMPFRYDGWRLAKYEENYVAALWIERGKIVQRIFLPHLCYQSAPSEIVLPHFSQNIRLSLFD